MFNRGFYYGERCFDGFRSFGFFSSPFKFIIPIVMVLLISYLIFRVVKVKKQSSDHSLELLKLKYVSGEINEEEYMNKREILLK